jgi:hypothetical protein
MVAAADPGVPAPVHEIVYVVVEPGLTDCDPEVATFPMPLSSVHAVAFDALHVRVDDPPCVIEIGFADKLTLTAGGAGATQLG